MCYFIGFLHCYKFEGRCNQTWFTSVVTQTQFPFIVFSSWAETSSLEHVDVTCGAIHLKYFIADFQLTNVPAPVFSVSLTSYPWSEGNSVDVLFIRE